MRLGGNSSVCVWKTTFERQKESKGSTQRTQIAGRCQVIRPSFF